MQVPAIKETLEAQLTEDSSGTRHLNQYILKQLLGSGSYGSVYEALDTEKNIKVAVKEFSKARLRRSINGRRGIAGQGLRDRLARSRMGSSTTATSPGAKSVTSTATTSSITSTESSVTDNPLDLVRTEVAILKKLKHDNVVKLYEVLNSDDDSLFMVFECCEKGPVMNLVAGGQVTPCSVSRARDIFRQTILGMEYLHEHDIAHRDIKPDNLLLTSDNVVKIVDFGVSEMFETKGQDKSSRPSGSPAQHGHISAKAADIWALGVTLYSLLYGYLPFHGESVFELYEAIKNQEPVFPETSDPLAVDLIKNMLNKRPDSRITMDKIRCHPWVTMNNTQPLISKEKNCEGLVTQLTDHDIENAFKRIRGIVTLMKAVHQFKKSVSNLS